mmetsp:Transcript_61055/g.145468  ORF Transcript_61055/g.145468 Transcript_61055/m.145468 type:complete len:346 (+) Transcript_61055:94-1131(+)
MASLMAEPWPSQRRLQTSERHSALDRLRQRHAREAAEEPPRVASDGGSRSQHRPHSERAPRKPLATRRDDDDDDLFLNRRSIPEPSPPSCPAPDSSGRPGTSRRVQHERHSEIEEMSSVPAPPRKAAAGVAATPASSSYSAAWDDRGSSSSSSTSRIRGPATARSVRSEPLDGVDEDPLPPGAQNANFGALQDMISKGIREAEVSAGHLEKAVADDMQELRRRQEENKRRRAQEIEAKQAEREKARKERRRAEEAKQRAQQEELQKQADLELRTRRESALVEETRKREHAAATRIQSRFRGMRSRRRRGTPRVEPAKQQPMRSCVSAATTAASSQGCTPEPELLK